MRTSSALGFTGTVGNPEPPTRAVEDEDWQPVDTRTQLEGADFTGANLTEAVLVGALSPWGDLDGCLLRRAKAGPLRSGRVDPARRRFHGGYFRGALLTGTSMPGAHFEPTPTCVTHGLADIDWEGADLRGADLRGATFHMGSSRSGLVGSPIACEGSKTGFYTDDYDEQTYKAPEEIRKANLCGADLRGANIEGVDFYLVDLRSAQFDDDQEKHLRRCGAILGTRL